ncbi:MAG: hypothetical protein WCP83_08895, partial [Actinomycetota bacterium]
MIEVKDIVKIYQTGSVGFKALSGVSFKINDGDQYSEKVIDVLKVVSVNDALEAHVIAATGNEDTNIIIDVLAGATDVDTNDTLSILDDHQLIVGKYGT